MIVPILERVCLVLWAICFIAAISCFGMGLMVLFIFNSSLYFGWLLPVEGPNPLITQARHVTAIGSAVLPVVIFAWYFGVNYLHFREHDDGISMDEEP